MKPSIEDYKKQIGYLGSLNLAVGDDNLIEYFDFQNGDSFENVFENFFSNFQYFFTKEKSNYNYPNPYLAFIEEDGINAFAGKTDDFSLIGINADTVRLLHQLFIEIDLESILSGSMDKFRIMEEVGLENFVTKLYYNCQMFIFFHEFGHIVQNIDGSSKFQNEMANQTNYSKIQHLKEYDADQFAAILMASSTSHWMEGLKGDLKDKYYNKEVSEMLLSIVCAGCFIPFLIFQKGTHDFFTKAFSHPHPSIRAGYILNTVVGAFKDNYMGSFEIDQKAVLNDAFEITRRVVNETASRNAIFESEDDFNKFYEIWVKNGDEINGYFDCLNNMAKSTKGLACHNLNR